MIDPSTIDTLRQRYSDVHPLVFHRSAERATTAAQLFDILESITKYPIVWDDDKHSWKHVEDLEQADRFEFF